MTREVRQVPSAIDAPLFASYYVSCADLKNSLRARKKCC